MDGAPARRHHGNRRQGCAASELRLGRAGVAGEQRGEGGLGLRGVFS